MSSQVLPALSLRQPANATVLAEVRNHIGHLTLNRPAGLNALDLEMIRALTRQLSRWAEDDAVYAVVLRGAGDKAFCAGGDIRALYRSWRQPGHAPGDEPLHHTFFAEEYALDLMLHHYRKPVLALMDGLVLGGGMGLVQSADLRVVTERSRLGMPEVAIGYFPDVGASHFLSRLPGELGIYLALSGAQIGAADALYCGLADWAMDSALLGRLDHMLDHLKWKSTPLKDLQGAMARLARQNLPSPPLAQLRPAIDHFFALPDIASIIEQLEQVNVADTHSWALDTTKRMRGHSPLAMAVTLEMLRRGRHLALPACFDMELHLDRQWFEQGDFLEGVRALIIDKDKKPHWKHARPQDVLAADVQGFFSGLEVETCKISN
ncbi:enoyl-CoA hydratase/isomerase family protein [Pseudomonas sp. v388]|uniref:enoyl-CoA hydratase/isomerase family protein n=1 Tax=Pseudomonas sp. v388 TaxID=2479849 RepID=UPI000F787BAC|nr:enoyl-CoA hydratase/isomerase family protein [Pseudomonas sp. v388]RRV05610.1 enoyl-CoA hydratase/isomerase family protein [Pseudomonas sp. v388]